MATSSGIYSEHYNDTFPTILRAFMAEHPITHKRVTQKVLGEAVGVRPQSISLYANGETQPSPDVLLKIADYFGETVDYLLTGTHVENKPVYEILGLSETTCENMKLVKDGYFEEYPLMLPLLDLILSEQEFYRALGQAAYSAYCAGQESKPEMKEFWAWKGAQALQQYFMNALSQNVEKAYDQKVKWRKK